MEIEIKTAIISAIAALSGVALTLLFTFLRSFLDKKHQYRIFQREKFEEMMLLFQDSLMYVQDLQNCRSREQMFSMSNSPEAQKALGLCLLYFRDLKDPMEQYVRAQVEFYGSIITSYSAGNPTNAGGQAWNSEKHQQVLQKLFKAKEKVLNLLNSKTKKYAKA